MNLYLNQLHLHYVSHLLCHLLIILTLVRSELTVFLMHFIGLKCTTYFVKLTRKNTH